MCASKILYENTSKQTNYDRLFWKQHFANHKMKADLLERYYYKHLHCDTLVLELNNDILLKNLEIVIMTTFKTYWVIHKLKNFDWEPFQLTDRSLWKPQNYDAHLR